MARYEVLTFDCYGTLIDWEGGMRAALASVIEKRGLSLSAEEVHRKYAEIEPSIQEGIGGKYVEVMRMGVEQTFRHFGVEVSEEEAGVFGDTLGSWPKFSDTTESLTEMKARGYKLVILSNTDENFIRQSIENIGVEFDEVITAQAVGSYKPARGHWDRMLATLGVSKEVVLHVAQSYYHDVVPAKGLGFDMAWINRKGQEPWGEARPDFEFRDLKSLLGIL